MSSQVCILEFDSRGTTILVCKPAVHKICKGVMLGAFHSVSMPGCWKTRNTQEQNRTEWNRKQLQVHVASSQWHNRQQVPIGAIESLSSFLASLCVPSQVLSISYCRNGFVEITDRHEAEVIVISDSDEDGRGVVAIILTQRLRHQNILETSLGKFAASALL